MNLNQQKVNESDEKKIDLSWLNLDTFHLPSYATFNHVQHIYLEGNQISRLDDEFFVVFKELKWLDLRNNLLHQIPKTVGNHPCLQVLLLEGNRLTHLPIELGSVQNLRGLQLARNPLNFPPKSVVDEGSTSVIQFLQTAWNKSNNSTEAATVSNVSSSTDNKKVSKRTKKYNFKIKPKEPDQSRSTPSMNLKDCVTVTKITGQPKLKKVVTVIPDFEVIDDDVNQMMAGDGKFEYQTVKNPDHFLPPTSSAKRKCDKWEEKNNDGMMVKSKIFQDIWIRNIRNVLEEQESQLQKNRDKDVLEKWQVDAKEEQLRKWAEYIHAGDIHDFVAPFDTDKEFRKMPSRVDLKKKDFHTRYKWKKSNNAVANNGEVVSSKISTVVDMLKRIRNARNTRTLSLHAEQEMLADEIKQINQLQRTLSSLKTLNFNHSI